MSVELFTKLVNLLSFLFLVTFFVVIVRGSLGAQVRAFGQQSWLLTALTALVAIFAERNELLGIAAIVALIKAYAVPAVLNRAVAKVGIQRAASPYLGIPSTLGVCSALVVMAFYVMAPVASSSRLPTADAVPLAFAGVLIGFFTTVNRKRAITQVLGFLMLENAIFLLALLATYGVPLIVELGVFLDVLVAVLILEIFIYRIKDNFDSIEVKHLGTLRG